MKHGAPSFYKITALVEIVSRSERLPTLERNSKQEYSTALESFSTQRDGGKPKEGNRESPQIERER